MKVISIATSFVAFLASKASGAHVQKLPECSLKQSSPCTCAAPSYYFETVALGVIGATIGDVRALINDFYDTYWYAHETPIKKIGPDNTVGSIRTFREPTGDLSEQLMVYKIGQDGSFTQRYQQYIDPAAAANGTKPTFYVTMKGKNVFQNETLVAIETYGCWTGPAPTLAESHEQGIQNAIDILRAGGKLTGITPTNFISTSFPKAAPF
ncbi:hypothetical protein CONLIGDRAFT_708306 [Coniochaeta ligniaria NRRL 30616]|uniref:Uncharacterized protein n=1 Tax=Coniochaeta ligniaria NRRL 30616 TaxID=1408157 RepID=A0A1J7IEC4_9PEZI|nr:hypothetical protein CONLIGDRAFT_708306 [Coniochaeta ligniaria NRRL 30616]